MNLYLKLLQVLSIERLLQLGVPLQIPLACRTDISPVSVSMVISTPYHRFSNDSNKHASRGINVRIAVLRESAPYTQIRLRIELSTGCAKLHECIQTY